MNFNDNVFKKIKNILWILILGVYPIFLIRGYSNVQACRVGFFSTCFIILGSIIFYYINKRRLLNNEKFSIKKFDIYEILAILFLVSSAISAVFAKYKDVAFDGRTDSYIGLFWYTILVLFFLLCKKEFEPKPWMFLVVCTTNWIIVIFSCIQFFGHDLFNMLSNVRTDSIQNFLSTFGNVGVFGQYITLMIAPVSAICMSKNKWYYHAIGMITAGFLSWGMIMSNTDATYLGCFITIILLFVVSIRSLTMLAGFLEMLFGMIMGNGIFSFIYSVTNSGRALSKMSGCMVKNGPLWMMIFGSLFLIFMFIIRYHINRNEKNCQIESTGQKKSIISTILYFTVIVMVMLVFLSFFYFSAIDRKTNLGSLGKLLRFTRHWGTDRGYIWLYVWEDFLKGGIFRHMFGFGEGSLEVNLLKNHLYELRYEAGFIPTSAHNLYLHMIFTVGIIGAGILLVVFVYVLAKGYKTAVKKFKSNTSDSVLSFCFISVLIGYLAQSAVSMTEPDVMPYVVLMYGILTRIGSKASIENEIGNT